MLLYDAHAHATAPALPADAARAVLNGTRPADWPQVAARAAAQPARLTPCYGLHPWYCATAPSDWLAKLTALLRANPRAQVGEIGLDRALLRRSSAAGIETQLAAFRAQLTLAAQLRRVASIHCVQAHGLLLETLQRAAAHAPADALAPLPPLLLHGYCGSAEMLPSFAKLGAYFSYGSAVIAPPRNALRAALRATPPERLLAETDAPFGTGTLADSYHALATTLGEPIETLAPRLAQNFQRLFPQTPSLTAL